MMKRVKMQLGTKQLVLNNNQAYAVEYLEDLISLVSCDYKKLAKYNTRGRIRFCKQDDSMDLQLSIVDTKSIISDESRGISLVRYTNGELLLWAYYGNGAKGVNIRDYKDDLVVSMKNIPDTIQRILNYSDLSENGSGVKVVITDDLDVFQKLQELVGDCYIFLAC